MNLNIYSQNINRVINKLLLIKIWRLVVLMELLIWFSIYFLLYYFFKCKACNIIY